MSQQTKPQLPVMRSSKSGDRILNISNHHWIYIVLGLLGIGYFWLTLNGYGNHDDIYRMIGTWRTLLSEYRYEPSRFQGYLVPEIIIGLSSQLGDFYLSNLVSALLGIASLFIFYQLLRYLIEPLPATLATLAVGTNPYWIIAATTSTDYIYPAFFFLLGVWLLIKGHFRVTGLMFALAVSSRLTYGPMAAIAYAFYIPYLNQKRLKKRFIQGIVIFLAASTLLYLPVFIASGLSLSFLGFADDTAGGNAGKIARYAYKNVYMWGLPTFLVLLVYFVQERRFYWYQFCKFPLRHPTASKSIFHSVFWLFIYNQLLFAKLPHQYQYLIPVLFCVVFLIALFPDFQKQVICFSLIAVLHLVYGVVNFDVIETYQTGEQNTTIHSDGAIFKPGVKEGILLRDYRWRSIYQHQFTEAFNQRWQHFGRSLSNPR